MKVVTANLRLWLLIVGCLCRYSFVFAVTADQPNAMPDGSIFETWEPATSYSHTYYVDQNHFSASDNNTGSESQPLKTIQKAAELVQPGEKVVIKAGTYREFVHPPRGGSNVENMISFESYPGHEVIISGSRLVQESWSSAGSNTWQLSLQDSWFINNYYPFKLANMIDEDWDQMFWAQGHPSESLKRGLVWHNGARLKQVSSSSGLSEGEYKVSDNGSMLTVRLSGNADPNSEKMEISVLQHVFKAETLESGWVRIAGLIFEHGAGGFNRTGEGMVNAWGGHHWIFEYNTFRECNNTGLEFGIQVLEPWNYGSNIANPRYPWGQEQFASGQHPGGIIVRGNTIHDCGTGGIRSHEVKNTLIEKNYIYNICFHEVEPIWETAAIKILIGYNVLIRDNLMHSVYWANCIWMDWQHYNIRITNNIMYDTYAPTHGAIFIEATTGPAVIDHNFLWDLIGNGVCLVDDENVEICHNVIGSAQSGSAIAIWSNEGREGNGVNNSIRNNVIFGQNFWIYDSQNTFNYNVFNESASWTDLGFNSQSVVAPISATFAPDTDNWKMNFTWSSSSSLASFPRVPTFSDNDFFEQPRASGNVAAGLFDYPTSSSQTFDLLTWEKPHLQDGATPIVVRDGIQTAQKGIVPTPASLFNPLTPSGEVVSHIEIFDSMGKRVMSIDKSDLQARRMSITNLKNTLSTRLYIARIYTDKSHYSVPVHIAGL